MYKQYKEEIIQNSVPGTPTSSPEKKDANKQETPRPELRRQKTGAKDGDKNWKPLERHKSIWNKDAMISYSHANKKFMLQLKEGLERHGIAAWVDVTGLKAGVDFLSKIGEAIIDSTLFISLLSEESIKSKYCQDELALAYVSSKPIFPVGMAPPEELFPKMDTGMKLQLARFRWHIFDEPEKFESCLEGLVQEMKAKMGGQDGDQDSSHQTDKPENKDKKDLEKKDDSSTDNKDSKSKRKLFNKQSMKKSMFYDRLESTTDNMSDEKMTKFWSRHFGKDTQSVPWPKFYDTFMQDYVTAMELIYSGEDKEWLMSILRRELEVDDPVTGVVYYDIYADFCTVDGEWQPFWLRVQDQAVESYTMKEVFSMDSSVRIEAIENLGKFRSAAVNEALMDLLTDPDTNVRAVAAISLARTGDDSPQVIKKLMKTLKDKDRLVRESGCLALGHLKATQAVKDILHLWRNDFISHVREAAQVALQQIGGEEAEKAIHMTKVLSDEIRFLTNE